jgi:hypothetical protein
VTNEKILTEARERFRICQSKESNARNNWKHDVAFGYGDSTNLNQWTGDTVDTRNAQGKPCFTINRTRVYCNAIIGDALNSKAQIEIRPVGNGASFQAAEVLEGICRHIEYISTASLAYEKAVHDQVFGGIGYWRVTTDYADNASFDQEIFIRPLDALAVYLDPHIQMPDGSDAEFGFVFTQVDKREFGKLYPKFKEATSEAPFGANLIDGDDSNWEDENRMRVVEYYRKVQEPDTLHVLDSGETVRESDAKEAGLLDERQQRSQRTREITVPKVEWYLICGNAIADTNEWPGKYIPIVRCVGAEVKIDGEIDRIGHVRCLIDSQRSLNWFNSSAIEYVAAQTKSPWIASVQAISGVEEYWRDANLRNYSVLPYNAKDDEGTELQAPVRADPPVYAAAFLDGMKVSTEEMELVSGQPPATLGEASQERSGKAVKERQRNAQNTTAYFVNNLASAIRFTGKILIDLIPKIYDTERTIKILAQDGTLQTVKVDPNQPQAYQAQQGMDGESFQPDQVAAALNPSIGDYDCVAEVGPQYTTRREEFVGAIMDILAQNESLTPIIGDLAFRNMDFPGSQEIADRMKRMVPPQALGQVDPHVQQLQQQLVAQHQLIQQMQQELIQAKSKAESIAFQKEIDVYKAITERVKTLGGIDPNSIRPVIREEVSQLLGLPVNPIIAAHMQEDSLMTQHAANQAAQLAQTDVQANAQQHAPMPEPQPPAPANGAGQ